MTTDAERRTEAARYLASLRPVREKPCAVCGRIFPARGRGRYCGEACKQRAKRARKKARGG